MQTELSPAFASRLLISLLFSHLHARPATRLDLFQNEWICPVCAFENRPRAKACTMCGTSRATAVEYYQQMRKAAGLDYEEDAAGTVYLVHATEFSPG